MQSVHGGKVYALEICVRYGGGSGTLFKCPGKNQWHIGSRRYNSVLSNIWDMDAHINNLLKEILVVQKIVNIIHSLPFINRLSVAWATSSNQEDFDVCW